MLPDIAAHQQDIYQVLAVGPGRKLEDGTVVPVEVAPGEKILVDRFAIQSKDEVAPSQFIIDESAVAMVLS